MHEFFILKEAVQGLGIEATAEELHPDVFGSAYCVFGAGTNPSFRLVWDGKDGFGILQIQDSVGTWIDIGPFVPEGAGPHSPQFSELLFVAKSMVVPHGPA